MGELPDQAKLLPGLGAVEAPAFWSDNAVRIVAAEYFRPAENGA